jgi:thioredoxin-dependent peroxiredoxin
MRMWIALLIAAAAAVLLASKLARPAPGPVAGNTAPDFTLSSQDRSQISLKDYRGKWVVLYFYPRDFTSGCTVEAHNFQRDQSQYAKRNAIVLGVSVDSPESHKRFCAQEGLNFKLLADTGGQVSKRYGSLLNFGVTRIAARHTFLITPEGKIERAYSNVNPNTHSQELLAALDQLQAAPETRAP